MPLAYDRDLQEDKPALFAAVENVLDSLTAAALLVEHLEFDRDRLSAAAADPLLLATDAAEALVRSGTPFRRAHEKIGRQVRDGEFAAPWNAKASVAKRDLVGGPGRRPVTSRARALRREAASLRRTTK